jgi:hypothetical protein
MAPTRLQPRVGCLVLALAILLGTAAAKPASSTVFKFGPALTPWANGSKAFAGPGDTFTNSNAA